MPRVKLPDGRVIAFPEGMSQDAMAEAMGSLPAAEPQQAPQQALQPPPAPQGLKSPLTPARDPRAEAIAKNLQGGGIGPSASWAVPGGPLAQMVGQGAVKGGESLLEGKGPLQAGKEGLGAAGGALAGGLLGKGLGKAASALDLPAYTEKVASKIADKLKGDVPAWSKMKGIKDMLYTQRGMNRLHREYDDSFNSVVKKATGNMIEVTAEDAKALGIKNMITPKMAPASSGQGMAAPVLVKVDAGDVVKGVQGKWSKDQQLYRRTTDLLDQHGFSDPEAKKAYKTAMGLRGYLDKTGAIRPDGTLDLMKAQKGLTQSGKVDQVLKRDLGDYLDLLQPDGKTLKKGSLAGPLGAVGGLLGAAGGGVGGHAAGPLGAVAGVPLGAGIGGYHGAKIGKMVPTYNIPGPVQSFLQRLGGIGGGAAGAAATPSDQ